MSSTNKTTYYELSQYVGSDKPTYLGDYNSDMLKIDTGLHAAADDASTALSTANAANSAATTASTTASTALSTAQTASDTASQAQTTAETALTNAGTAQTAAEEAETAARANTVTNLAPAYDPALTYNVGELVTYIDAQGSGKLYKCIVAVTTPEAFNINKWDDVTVSEAFEEEPKIIEFVGSDYSSYAELLFAVRQSILSNYKPGHRVDFINKYTGEYPTYMSLVAINDVSRVDCEIRLGCVNPKSTECEFRHITITNNSATAGTGKLNYTSSTVTYTSIDTSAADTGRELLIMY